MQLVYNDMVWALRRVVIVEKSPYPSLSKLLEHVKLAAQVGSDTARVSLDSGRATDRVSHPYG